MNYQLNYNKKLLMRKKKSFNKFKIYKNLKKLKVMMGAKLIGDRLNYKKIKSKNCNIKSNSNKYSELCK